MKKHLITENITPTETIPKQFSKDLRFAACLSSAECGKGKFVLNAPPLVANPCGGCVQVPNSAIIDKAKTKISGKTASGELLFSIKCFGTVASLQGASNMCEFEGNSDCYIESSAQNSASNAESGTNSNEPTNADAPTPETAGANETAQSENLLTITLTRDYQMSGGVAGREIKNENGVIIGTTKAGITLGRLTVKDDVFYTIEPQWVGNAKVISCIPEGEYYLKWNERAGSKYKDKGFDVYTLDGTSRELAGGRTDILIHAGRDVRWTKGCIIIGKSFEKRFALEYDADKNPVFDLKNIIDDEAYLKITSGKSGAIKDTI